MLAQVESIAVSIYVDILVELTIYLQILYPEVAMFNLLVVIMKSTRLQANQSYLFKKLSILEIRNKFRFCHNDLVVCNDENPFAIKDKFMKYF